MDLSTLLQQILDTVKEPTADPRRTVVLIAIGLVIFLIVALFVFILLPSEKREDVDEWTPEDATGGGPSNVLVAVSLVLVLLVVAGFVYGDRRSRQDATCRSCHVLSPAVESWKTGSHPKVACIECHTSPGVFGGIETRVRALSDAVNNLGGNPTLGTPATVNQGDCRSCHEKALSGVMAVGRVRVRHLDFVDRLPCSQCHGRVGHESGPGKSPLSSAMMTACADCHDGKTASRDCRTCHVGDIAYAGKGPAEYALVQLGAPTTCKGCHSLEKCTACHGIEMPHPAGWADPRKHARSGAFDTTVCVRCHDTDCTPCHSYIHSSHADWKSGHQTADRSTCTNCHDASKVGADMCLLCHPGGAGG